MTLWPSVPLGELLRRSEPAVALRPDSEYREITVRLWGKGVVERGRAIGSSFPGGRRFIARTGQFIVSRIDARNGAMGLVPQALDGAIVTNDFPIFTVNDDRLLPAYLGWLCKTSAFVDLCRRASEGTTNRVRLQEDRFLRLPIALPPLPQQRQVVARIEELAGQLQETRSLRQQAAVETDALVSAETSRIFDGLTGCSREAIGVLGYGGENPVQTGPFGAQLHASEFTADGVPVLNVGNVWPDGLRFDRLDHVHPDKAASLNRYVVEAGDLLFARSGATLGKVCLVPVRCDGWLMTGHLFRVRFDHSRVDNRFAFAAFRGARSVQDQVFGQVRGATRPGFNTTLLANVRLPLPSLSKQRDIVAQLDLVQGEVNALKRLQSETAAELELLLPAILHRAFKGELA